MLLICTTLKFVVDRREKNRAIFVVCSSTHVNLKGLLGYGMSLLTISMYFQSKLGLGEDFYFIKMYENCTHR